MLICSLKPPSLAALGIASGAASTAGLYPSLSRRTFGPPLSTEAPLATLAPHVICYELPSSSKIKQV